MIKIFLNLSSRILLVSLIGKSALITKKSIFPAESKDAPTEEYKIKFNYGTNRKGGFFKNPYLTNLDIVFVGKGKLIKTYEFIIDITKPFQGIIQSYEFCKLISQ